MNLVRLTRRILLIMLVVASVPAQVIAQTEASFDRVKMDAYLDALNNEQRFMGTVDIDSAGSDVYNHSVGFISAEDDTVMADEQTIYRIGSITKTFTAVVIMQLVEEGSLSLSTNLAQFYPNVPQANSVTIEDLLRHQSGIPGLSASTLPQEWLRDTPTKQQKLELLRGLEPDFEPGSKESYSNTNYVILEFIIEEVTGESYPAQIEQRITKPLGLQRTHFGDSIDVEHNEAASFEFRSSQWRKMPAIDPSIPGGAGGIVSTPSDLTDFIYALFESQLVSQESLNTMTTLQQGMGIGMYEIEYSGALALGHKGGGQGFFSHLAYFPGRKVAVAYSANGLDYSRDDIFAGVASIYFGDDFKLPDF
jgi:CubicO group peptidase (beta-lactamase class C family)